MGFIFLSAVLIIQIWNILPRLQSLYWTFFSPIYLFYSLSVRFYSLWLCTRSCTVFKQDTDTLDSRFMWYMLHFWNWNLTTTYKACPYFHSFYAFFWWYLCVCKFISSISISGWRCRDRPRIHHFIRKSSFCIQVAI